MKYDELNLQKIREVPIFDVCSKLGINLYGMGKLAKRATCWYHDDKHPSMHVNKKKNIYKCFVCGKGGDVIRLVQDYDNKTFVEACDWLVNEFHVVLIDDKSSAPSCSPALSSRLSEAHGEISKDSMRPLDYARGDKGTVEMTLTPHPSGILHQTPFIPLPSSLVTRSLSLNSQFCKSVVSAGYLTDTQLRHAADRYRLGCSKEGGVIFWEIDDQQRVHTGKIMYYQPDCHRDKQHNPTWVHSLMKDKLPANYELQHCLFGLHLLTSDISHQTSSVALVESEKTAIILSEKFPDFIWLSCGGLQMFKPELLAPLVNHKVVIFPDTDETGEAYKAWLAVLQQAQRQYVFKYPLRISRLLENHASQEQKQQKIDLVDFLFPIKNESNV